MKKRALIFDLFFTLVVPRYSERAEETEFAILGLGEAEWEELCSSTYRPRALGAVRGAYEMMEYILEGRGYSEAAISAATEARLRRYRTCLEAVSGATLSALAALRRAGCALVLASNADAIDIAPWKLSPLAPLFDAAVFSYDVGVMKPDAGIYEIAMERAGAAPEDCLFIGDGGHHELAGARALGIETALITEHIAALWPERIESLALDADYRIASLGELVRLLGA